METRVKIKEIMKQLDATFVEREQAIQCIWLALLTKQNFILVGDPGTAKTALVHAAYAHIEVARIFATLCGSFATEDKIFGPTDIKAFQAGEYKKSTKGRLADCELAFLDEMLKTNEGTLNGMLTALNERTYEGQPIALRTCGAATNWPEVKARSENVAALWDRVLLRCEVKDLNEIKDPTQRENLRVKMLEAVDKVRDYKPALTISIAELDQAYAEIQQVAITEAVRRSMVSIQSTLEGHKIRASSRRYGALQQALRALAWLDGRKEVLLDDFDALMFGLWADRDQIEPVRATVDAVDHEVVNTCKRKLTEVLQKCQGTPAATMVPTLLANAAQVSSEVRTMMGQRGARKKGKAEIKNLIEELRVVYNKLCGTVDKHGVKQQKKTPDQATDGTKEDAPW